MDCLNRVSGLDSDFYGLGRLYLDGVVMQIVRKINYNIESGKGYVVWIRKSKLL